MTLTTKQERFCQEYLIDCNGTQAAIRAGYSPAYANTQASKMLALEEIKKRIEELQADRQLRTEIKADRVVNELALIAFSNISDFIEVVDSFPVVKSLENIDPEKMKAIKTIKTSRDGSVTIELHNKLGALVELSKIMGLVSDLNIAIATFHKYGILVKQNGNGEWYIDPM